MYRQTANTSKWGVAMYVNHLSAPSEEFIRAAYGANYSHLAQIKKKYDHTNVLGLNPNIGPA